MSDPFRYNKTDFLDMCKESVWSNLFLRVEEACYSVRFDKG